MINDFPLDKFNFEINNGELTELDLSNISSHIFKWNILKTLPEFISTLSSLKNLDLKINRLTMLPESIGSLSSLQSLDLSYNNLEEVPEVIQTLKSLEKLNIKQDLIFKLKDVGSGEKTVHIPFNQLDNYMRPACRACDDFTNIYSDISFGGLGSQNKYTTVITRTEKGADIFSKVKNAGIIRVLDINEPNKNKMIELISQFSQSKIERKETFMKKLK